MATGSDEKTPGPEWEGCRVAHQNTGKREKPEKTE